MFAQLRDIGLVNGKIQSYYDEPVLVWKSNFVTGTGTGGRKRLGGIIR
jgi:hypothetical protein